ncbi:MAG: tetratricopeptide repeat protein, partial [Myxococcota bacterium]
LDGTPLERAAALIEAGDAEAAEEILIDLRKSSPGKAEVWRLSAQAAVDLGRYREGVQRAQRAIARAPRRFESWVAKGSALQFDGRIREAIRSYERALKVDAEHPRSEEVRTVITKLGGELSPEP